MVSSNAVFGIHGKFVSLYIITIITIIIYKARRHFAPRHFVPKDKMPQDKMLQDKMPQGHFAPRHFAPNRTKFWKVDILPQL